MVTTFWFLRNIKHHNHATFMNQKVALLTAERIWFKCDLYLRFIPPINLWKVCIDLRPKFGFHLVLTSFHLEFSSFGISRLFDLGDLSVLKNGARKHFENGLKSIQIFQRLMGGMNRR